MTATPLVSIGLPTYNRAAKLERAMEFVLAQDYPNLEVVISDNASTDETAQICKRLSLADPRIRYIRQSTNIGPTANYRAVLEAATGDMYMALADDDWIDPNYVRVCVDALLGNPDLVLACGQPQMYRDGSFSRPGVTTSLLEDSPSDRVVSYYKTVVENGAFHGLIRREVLLRLPKMTSVMAGDWLWMAAIAFQGKIETLPSTAIIKHMGGASVSWAAIIAALNLPKWQARYWPEAILKSIGRDILWQSPVYETLGVHGRLLLFSRVALTLGLKWRIWMHWRSSLKQLVVGPAPNS